VSSLLAEIESYPGGFEETRDLGGVAVPLELFTSDGRLLRFLTTVTTFGTALDLTAAELSIEAFLPADDATAATLPRRCERRGRRLRARRRRAALRRERVRLPVLEHWFPIDHHCAGGDRELSR